ncbi:unnamed protein product [Tuber aestivum]|uniref:Uncharacterized protein n=1 Tax=Tuber aestivum TaxID=59557 RepID=A0A292Q4M7_9PEZI|nr:unnamed protein product [Tuber aestivum]
MCGLVLLPKAQIYLQHHTPVVTYHKKKNAILKVKGSTLWRTVPKAYDSAQHTSRAPPPPPPPPPTYLRYPSHHTPVIPTQCKHKQWRQRNPHEPPSFPSLFPIFSGSISFLTKPSLLYRTAIHTTAPYEYGYRAPRTYVLYSTVQYRTVPDGHHQPPQKTTLQSAFTKRKEEGEKKEKREK